MTVVLKLVLWRTGSHCNSRRRAMTLDSQVAAPCSVTRGEVCCARQRLFYGSLWSMYRVVYNDDEDVVFRQTGRRVESQTQFKLNSQSTHNNS